MAPSQTAPLSSLLALLPIELLALLLRSGGCRQIAGDHAKSISGTCLDDQNQDPLQTAAALPLLVVGAVAGALPPHEPVLLQSDLPEEPEPEEEEEKVPVQLSPPKHQIRVRRVRFEVTEVNDENVEEVEEPVVSRRPRARSEYDLESLISALP